jgi:hypothetical protein
MVMSRLMFVALVLSALWARPLPVDVSGRWAVSLFATDGTEGPVIDLMIEQDDEKLTGSCSLQDLDDNFTMSGQVREDGVSWQCSSARLRMTFSGSMRSGGREMTGSWTTSADGAGTFTASKR